MPIDISKVKQKLSQLTSQNKKNADGSFEKTDWKKIMFKPRLGKQIIRLVPIKTNPSEPFLEVSYHEGLEKFRILALSNFGEKDPVLEFATKLRATGDKDDKDLAWKLSPKKRYFAQVIVRGEEHLGARLWEFGKPTYNVLLSIIANDDYGDILDVNDGNDITLEGIDDSFSGIKYVKVNSIVAKPKKTALAAKEEDIRGFLDNQYDPLSLGKKFTYQELFLKLQAWLSPEEGDEVTTGGGEAAETEQPKDALDEALEAEVVDEELPFTEEEGEAVEVEVEEEPPFVPDPKPAKNAIAAASKRIIAKNNAEIAKTATAPKIKTPAPKAPPAKKTEAVTATITTASGGDKKKRFDELFGVKK